MTKDKLDMDFKEMMENTEVFKKCESFKQKLLGKTPNIQYLRAIYFQAKSHGLEYIKQNPSLTVTDVKIIEEIIKNESCKEK